MAGKGYVGPQRGPKLLEEDPPPDDPEEEEEEEDGGDEDEEISSVLSEGAELLKGAAALLPAIESKSKDDFEKAVLEAGVALAELAKVRARWEISYGPVGEFSAFLQEQEKAKSQEPAEGTNKGEKGTRSKS